MRAVFVNNMAEPTNVCCVHVIEIENGKITPLSAKSARKIDECRVQWLELGGNEQIIAQTKLELVRRNSSISPTFAFWVSYP